MTAWHTTVQRRALAHTGLGQNHQQHDHDHGDNRDIPRGPHELLTGTRTCRKEKPRHRQVTKQQCADAGKKHSTGGNIFGALGDAAINVDMIVSNISSDGMARHSFTMHTNDLGRAQAALKPVLGELSSDAKIETEAALAKLSTVGIGMRSHSGVAAKMFQALGKAGINIGMITTSEIKISVTVSESQIEDAARVVHEAFELDKKPLA